MLRRSTLVLLCTLATTVGAQSRPPRETAEQLRMEAVNILQGVDSMPFLDPARVRLVARALGTIRRQLPQLAGITAGRDRLSLVVYPADSVAHVFTERSGAERPRGARPEIWTVRVNRVGIRAIDSLNRVFDVQRAEARYRTDMSQLRLYFRRPVNIPVVAEAYARVAQVQYAGRASYIGDRSWIRLIPKGRRMHLVFSRGSGDCPSGCIVRDYYYVTFDTLDRSVVLEQQALNPSKAQDTIAYWDIPSRYSRKPYPTVDSLYAGLRDERWWYRQHAVHVLAMILQTKTEGGPADQNAPLERAVHARRRESFEALIDRLGDADPDVARLAHRYLRELSGRTFPGGTAGIPQWRRWLNESR